ncbi:MAG: ATP-binding protein [Steroidobacteraceae bacterium]|nr:ATP-binding protein [Deltaproteobacteria bacterium]
MTTIRNPFSKTVIGDDEPLCNQKNLLSALMLEARSGNNNVLLAPRRAGKTSLAMRLARDYRAEGGLATLADLSAVPSADAAADRIATALFASLGVDSKIFKKLSQLVTAFVPVITMNPDGSFSVSASASGLTKSGIDRLVSVVASIDSISSQSNTPLLVIFDEFQDLAMLSDGAQIEAALRSTIQHHKASYLFIGSRRKLLRDMFESPKRAFYRGATTRELPLIETDEFSAHLIALAKVSGAVWSREITDSIIATAEAHTYSVTAIAHALYEMTVPDTPTAEDLAGAINTAADRESSLFMSIYASLTPQARMLIEAIADEPTKHPMAGDYMSRHKLTNAATVRKSLVALVSSDHVAVDGNGLINLTDPLLKRWLNSRWGKRHISGLPGMIT